MSSSSSKDAASWRKKKDQIHFVNARPSSETEKLKIQRMVRAHVGKWISDQTRDRSAVPESPGLQDSSGRDGAGESQEPGGSDGSSRVTVLEGYELVSRSSSSPDALDSSSHSSLESNVPASVATSVPASSSAQQQSLDRHTVRSPSNTPHRTSPEINSNGNLHTYNHNRELVSSRPPALSIERIGSSVWDPFHTYPSHYSPEFLRLHEGYSWLPSLCLL